MRRLRLRGDWSDTGPDARPERELAHRPYSSRQAGPQLHASIMRRMTEVLSRMISDPQTQAVLNQMDVNEDTDFSESVAESGVLDVTEDNVTVNPTATPAVIAVPEITPEIANTSRSSPQPSSSFTIPASTSNVSSNNKRMASSNDNYSDLSDDDNDESVKRNTNRNRHQLNPEPSLSDFDYLKMKFMGHRNARYLYL